MLRLSAALVLLALAAPAALADCSDDIATLTARLDAALNQKAPNIVAARKQLAEAQDPMADEVACDNAVARAWRAYRATPEPAPAAKPGQ